jgi:hypothetical protein
MTWTWLFKSDIIKGRNNVSDDIERHDITVKPTRALLRNKAMRTFKLQGGWASSTLDLSANLFQNRLEW